MAEILRRVVVGGTGLTRGKGVDSGVNTRLRVF